MKRTASHISTSPAPSSVPPPAAAMSSTPSKPTLDDPILLSIPLPLPPIYPNSIVLIRKQQTDTFDLYRVISATAAGVKVREMEAAGEQRQAIIFPWDSVYLLQTARFMRGATILALWQPSDQAPIQPVYRRGRIYAPKVYSMLEKSSDAYCVLYQCDGDLHGYSAQSREVYGRNIPQYADLLGMKLPTVIMESPAAPHMEACVEFSTAYEAEKRERKRLEREAKAASAAAAGAGSMLMESLQGGVAGAAREMTKARDGKRVSEETETRTESQQQVSLRALLARYEQPAPSTPFGDVPLRRADNALPIAPQSGPYAALHAPLEQAHAYARQPRDTKLLFLYASSLAEPLATPTLPVVPLITTILPLVRKAARGRGAFGDPALREWAELLPPAPLAHAPPQSLWGEQGVAAQPPPPVNAVHGRVSADQQVPLRGPSELLRHSRGYRQHAAYLMRVHPRQREAVAALLREKNPQHAWTARELPDHPALLDNTIPVPFSHPLVPLPSLSTLVAIQPRAHQPSDALAPAEAEAVSAMVLHHPSAPQSSLVEGTRLATLPTLNELALPAPFLAPEDVDAAPSSPACAQLLVRKRRADVLEEVEEVSVSSKTEYVSATGRRHRFVEPQTLRSGVVSSAYVSLF